MNRLRDNITQSCTYGNTYMLITKFKEVTYPRAGQERVLEGWRVQGWSAGGMR